MRTSLCLVIRLLTSQNPMDNKVRCAPVGSLNTSQKTKNSRHALPFYTSRKKAPDAQFVTLARMYYRRLASKHSELGEGAPEFASARRPYSLALILSFIQGHRRSKSVLDSGQSQPPKSTTESFGNFSVLGWRWHTFETR